MGYSPGSRKMSSPGWLMYAWPAGRWRRNELEGHGDSEFNGLVGQVDAIFRHRLQAYGIADASDNTVSVIDDLAAPLVGYLGKG